MSKMSKLIDKLFIVMGVVLLVTSCLIGGFDLGHHDYQSAVPNLILAGFWAIFLFVMIASHVESVRFKTEMDGLERFS